MSKSRFYPVLLALTIVALLSLIWAPVVARAQEPEKKFRVAYIVKMGDNPWFVTEARGIQEVADAKGVELTIQDVKLDPALAMDAVDQAIGTGVDGIIIVVPDQKIGPAVLKKAAEANIPVVTIDDYIYDSEGKQAPFVGFFAPDIGRQVAEKAIELYKASGWDKDPNAVIRAVSIELPTLSVCNMRTDASTETWLKAFPDFGEENVLHMPYDGTLKGAADAFPAFITAHPEITHWVLWSCNDDGVLGAVRSLENAGVKAENIIGVGLGAHMACDEWNKGKPTGFKAAVYINAALHGKKAMEVLYDYLANGTPIPENSIVQGVMVDPTNYATTIEGCVAPGTQAPAEGRKWKIGYIAAGTQYYYMCQESGVRKKAAEMGVDLVVLNSDSKADKEISNMEDMISKKVDIILMMTTNAAAGQKALQLANAANIPVILVGIDVEPGPGKAVSLIDFDFMDMGRVAGEWVAANVPEGEVAIIEGLAGMNVAEPITAGFEEKLAANPNLKIVAKQPADWSRQKAQEIATNLLLAHPNLKVIYGHNDDMSMGIIKAVEAAGKQDQVIVVSDNASPEGVEAIKAGKLAGSVAQSPAVAEGERAVELAIDYLNGKPIPEHEREELFFLTKDNLDKAKPWCYE